ncbi:MAG: hypothetical protein BRC24_01740 [Parcubacteria group bacterium SW_4_46_8]|nr:MAG: hypothetical protein BRC24_01740 [Parcubacteria group bacterium SW_4_46_8]
MNTAVLIFFFHNVLATFLLGGKFLSQESYRLRLFGIGLLLDGIAFLIWAFAIINQVQESLEGDVFSGALFFLLSLLFFFFITINLRSTYLYVLGGIVFLILAGARIFALPSSPAIIEGFFFFNPHPFTEMFYILLMMLIAVPAIEVASREIPKLGFKNLFRYGFFTEVGCGIALLVTSVTTVEMLTPAKIMSLYLIGTIAGVMYFALWTIFLFSPHALTAHEDTSSAKSTSQFDRDSSENLEE